MTSTTGRYDLGNGDWGWGNNELQTYTNSSSNSFVADGKLFIVAEKVGENAYTSARLKSLDLQEFQYGRIDVRAILPKGQGIWPAIWMLGANYPDVGWPACGEIDIMELLGHLPGTIHGTAHWGMDWPNWTHQGLSTSIYPENFDEEFHVFSIDWSEDNIDFILDDEVFFNINPNMMNGQPYPRSTTVLLYPERGRRRELAGQPGRIHCIPGLHGRGLRARLSVTRKMHNEKGEPPGSPFICSMTEVLSQSGHSVLLTAA